MRQDDRAPFVQALARARALAYPPGEFVNQESFMLAGEILDLAKAAGVAPGVSVLDLCCGIAGPGRLITAELGCDYLGVDYSESAVEIARERAQGLPCTFQVARVPPLPAGWFDVVLLLETLLAFRDKAPLLQGVAEALTDGGRFALTLEEGRPLSAAERAAMPDADTVWLTPLTELVELVEAVGLRVVWQRDRTAAHLGTARALLAGFQAEAEAITTQLGPSGRRALDELIAAHRLWCSWLASGRARKFALVVEKSPQTVLNPAPSPPRARRAPSSRWS